MEARACGVPVITTEFGSLKHYLGSDYSSIWYSEPKYFLKYVKEIQNILPNEFKKTKVAEINKAFFSIIHSAIKSS